MLTTNQLRDLIGTDAHANSGEKIGKVEQVYVDGDTEQPAFAAVHTGFLGMKESLVPIDGATFDGSHLTVPYDKETVKAAPAFSPNAQITAEEADELYRHYGLTYQGPSTASERARAHAGGTGTTESAGDAVDSDGAMTRSEERLHVGTRQEEAGRVRLRKYVVTEDVTTTVPVHEERAVLEREPITGESRDAAHGDAQIAEGEQEVVLHREVPVVAKETEAVERVRLSTEDTQHEETVTDQVRKEQIDVDDQDGVLDRSDRSKGPRSER